MTRAPSITPKAAFKDSCNFLEQCFCEHNKNTGHSQVALLGIELKLLKRKTHFIHFKEICVHMYTHR